MRRAILAVEAEIAWHDELDATLAEACGGHAPAALSAGKAIPLGEGSFQVAPPYRMAFDAAEEERGADAAAGSDGAARASTEAGAGRDGAGRDGAGRDGAARASTEAAGG